MQYACIIPLAYSPMFSNMALPLLHTFAGLELQQAMRRGAYKQLRFFAFGGMSVHGNLHSTEPVWARTDGAVHYYNKSLDSATHTWFNASFGASIEPHCCYSHTHISWGLWNPNPNLNPSPNPNTHIS